jgi:hypothetical protein
MIMPETIPKLIKCYEYGTLRNVPRAEEETWIFVSPGLEFTYLNSNIIETLDELSMEGWDLVCKDGLEYILRTPVEKQEPQPCDEDDEEIEEEAT